MDGRSREGEGKKGSLAEERPPGLFLLAPCRPEVELDGEKCIFRRFVFAGLGLCWESLGSELVRPLTCKSSATARKAANLSCPMLTSPWYMKSSMEASSCLGTPLR